MEGFKGMEAKRLGELLLSRWAIEKRSFWVRDVLFREDACRAGGWGRGSWQL
ncbi:hypothetical protein TJA_19740 [Thermus sp. LT1-2-5]|uniref:hypothetical protein n=1 Tax=Thermus sp. LT1-2-5 TaxID=3026935 RepID=UPI0030E76714